MTDPTSGRGQARSQTTAGSGATGTHGLVGSEATCQPSDPSPPFEERTLSAVDEAADLRRRIAEVMKAHWNYGGFCDHDGLYWPCWTVRTLAPEVVEDSAPVTAPASRPSPEDSA